jgi:hypothetical protein
MMLTIDQPLAIEGRTILRDDEKPETSYYVGEPRYLCSEYGHPKLALFKLRWPHWQIQAGNVGNGVFFVGVETGLPEETLQAITAQLRQRLVKELGPNTPEPALKPVQATRGEATLMILDQALTLPASMEDNHQTLAEAVFTLPPAAVNLVERGLPSEKMIGVKFNLWAAARHEKEISERLFSTQGYLPPLSSLSDVTGQPLRLEDFVTTGELQKGSVFQPFVVYARLREDISRFSIRQITLFIDFGGGAPVLSHAFEAPGQVHRFAAPRNTDEWTYQYWTEIRYQDSRPVLTTRAMTTDQRQLDL